MKLKPSDNKVFTALFTHSDKGVTRELTFTLEQYIAARMWMATNKKESAALLTIWLNESNQNRQAAYCAVKVWRDELNRKGAQ